MFQFLQGSVLYKWDGGPDRRLVPVVALSISTDDIGSTLLAFQSQYFFGEHVGKQWRTSTKGVFLIVGMWLIAAARTEFLFQKRLEAACVATSDDVAMLCICNKLVK